MKFFNTFALFAAFFIVEHCKVLGDPGRQMERRSINFRPNIEETAERQSMQNFDFDLDKFDHKLTLPRQLSEISGASELTNNFVVKLDCSLYRPEEITVKIVGNMLIINGKHEHKSEKHGFVSRKFTRRYSLPTGLQANKVVASLNPNGVLKIEAPKKSLESTERHIQITLLDGAQDSTGYPAIASKKE